MDGRRFWAALAITFLAVSSTFASDHGETPAERGYSLLRTKPYLPADFDQEVFENLWKAWPEPERTEAANAPPEKRLQMIRSYYGFVPDPDNSKAKGPGLAYVKTEDNGWAMNCLACHGGKVAGEVIPGLPNSHIALQTLTEDVRVTKLTLRKKLTHLDMGTLSFPLSMTDGSTNSVVFGILLGDLRDKDMKVQADRQPPKVIHHDMDAPPFWNVKKKSRLYVDGHLTKSHRPLMQFMLLPVNDQKTVLAWEPDFRDILAWIESVEAPKWKWDIDKKLATRGEKVFNNNCAECHGTYGETETYPERLVPLDEIGTDPVRVNALTEGHLEWMKNGWMSRYGKDPVTTPSGYVAPPLDGVWASAPYFHNGSVPTLWHVLHPEDRPKIWKRTENGYDKTRVGLEVQTIEEIPYDATVKERRRYFDTRIKGKNAGGHDYPSKLTKQEKQAVLEYLKTL